MPPATLEAPQDAGVATEPKPKKEKKKATITDLEIVDVTPTFKGLTRQIDELKTDLALMKREKKDARELAVAIGKLNMDIAMKEADKAELSKCINALEKRRDAKVCELIELETGRTQPKLPFKEVESKPAEKKEQPAPEDWKAVTAEALLGADGELTKKQKTLVEKLHDNGLKTFGDITAYLKDERKHLTDLKGVGPAAARMLEDAMEAYWTAHPPAKDAKPEGATDPKAVATLDQAGAPQRAYDKLEKYLSPADVNLDPGHLPEMCHATLIAEAPYAGGGERPKLHACIPANGSKPPYVVTPTPGQPDTIYTLRPLLPIGKGEPVNGDPYAGRRVLLDGVEYEIGKQKDCLLVKDDGDEKKPVFDPTANRDHFGKAEETVPLKEAMGDSKGKKKKGRNKRK